MFRGVPGFLEGVPGCSGGVPVFRVPVFLELHESRQTEQPVFSTARNIKNLSQSGMDDFLHRQSKLRVKTI